MSVPLLSEYVGKDTSTIYEQLLVLTSQEFITKSYDSSYRLPPRPATYALAAKGISYLRNNTAISQTALRNMYKNKTASEPLVVQSLDVFKLCVQLTAQYRDTFAIFTRTELASVRDTFVKPLPQLYLRRKRQVANRPRGYQIELLEPGVFSWILRKRLRAHEETADELEDSSQYPAVLFICGNQSTERRIHTILQNSYLDFPVLTTTRERLQSGATKIWLEEQWDDEEAVYQGL